MLKTDLVRGNSLAQPSISVIADALAPKEAPLFSWLGGWRGRATEILHGYTEDFLLPNYITTSTAINSATAATGITVASGLGSALTVGTILENEGATPEYLVVTSIPGPNSLLLGRNYDGSGIGSITAGSRLRVKGAAGIEGSDHNGLHTGRFGGLKFNTVGYYSIPLAASGSQLSQGVYGANRYEDAVAKAITETLHMTEKEIIGGVLNAANSLGTGGALRTTKGIRGHISSVNSAFPASSIQADPHTYLGGIFEAMYSNGANANETWGLVVGPSLMRAISGLHDTVTQTVAVGNPSDPTFQRVITRYTGPLGSAEVILGRGMRNWEGIFVSRDRTIPVVYREWDRLTMAKTGDNQKDLLVGEFAVEVHHESAMGRLVGTA